MTHTELKTLARLASEAASALIPLAADPHGRDSHGGRIANPEVVIARALGTLEHAGRLASEYRRRAHEEAAPQGPGTPPAAERNLFRMAK
ncbi:MAG: hypothetical protein KIT22_03030 [Verrucomicrobiae bacterium]|nr:hypothetical protein [Verrucomicrobiae bacterium]